MRSTEYTMKKGKDASPLDTIARIRHCLEEINLTCAIHLYEQDMPGCCSARVHLEGPLSHAIAANGKGTSLEYCLASGHAELIERIQNQIFQYQIHPKDLTAFFEKNPLSAHAQCRMEPFAEMRENKNSFLNRIVQKYINSIPAAKDSYDKELTVWAKLHQLFPLWSEIGVLTIPFYHVQTGKYEWLPFELIKTLNLSNGMAAGNTLEEALVQGYSEVFERYAQCQILQNEITPPRLPDSVLSQFPEILKIIEKIELSGPYRVTLRDCSLDMGLPVVCGIIANLEKQTFGIRFGAHPDLQIALERIFTEAMQGKSLEEFSQFNVISYQQQDVHCQQNMFNLLKTGGGLYSPSILVGSESYPSALRPQQSDFLSNQELVKQMTEQLLAMRKDLYIADVSYLGFPCVCIYAEDISELIPVDDLVLKANVIKNKATNFLQKIPDMNREDAEELLQSGALLRRSVLENTIPTMCKLPIQISVHGGNDQIGFLMVVCHYYLGNDAQAVELLKQCIEVNKKNQKEYAYEAALLKFLQGILANVEPEKIAEILYEICEKETAQSVLSDFAQRPLVFSRLYPSCDQRSCNSCSNPDCSYQSLKEFYETLFLKMADSNVWTSRLHKILRGNHVR